MCCIAKMDQEWHLADGEASHGLIVLMAWLAEEMIPQWPQVVNDAGYAAEGKMKV